MVLIKKVKFIYDSIITIFIVIYTLLKMFALSKYEKNKIKKLEKWTIEIGWVHFDIKVDILNQGKRYKGIKVSRDTRWLHESTPYGPREHLLRKECIFMLWRRSICERNWEFTLRDDKFTIRSYPGLYNNFDVYINGRNALLSGCMCYGGIYKSGPYKLYSTDQSRLQLNIELSKTGKHLQVHDRTKGLDEVYSL